MIKRRGIIVMTVASRLPQFMWNTYKYHNDDFYVTRERLQEMYRIKYSRNYTDTTLHPFKVVAIK